MPMETDFFTLETWTTHFSETTAYLKSAILGYLPNIAGALFIVILGWILARIVKFMGSRGVGLIFNVLGRIEKKYTFLSQKTQKNIAQILGQVFYWIVLVYFLFLSLRVLNIPGIKAWLTYYSGFIPNLLGAVVIVIVGFMFGGWIKNLIYSQKESTQRDNYFLAQVIRFVIIALFVVWGVGQVGFNINVLSHFINIILAAVLGSAALGFGLGASGHVTNIIGAFNFKSCFQVGDTLVMDDIQGVILEITKSTIVLDTQEGIVIIPARKALDTICKKVN